MIATIDDWNVTSIEQTLSIDSEKDNFLGLKKKSRLLKQNK